MLKMPGLAGTNLGRYTQHDRLGRGGMSEVYLAYDELRQQNVAIKVVGSNHSDYLERFHREAMAISTLEHAHILPALDYGEQGLWNYIVMPYIEQGTLRERLLRGPLTLEEAGVILEQVGGALQFAHDQGIVHRDIKPSNILMRDDRYAFLADFGLAKSLEEGSTITQSGNLLGTPEYMAPELAEGPATTSSDLYALGILLYQMLTGQLPFIGETPIAVYWKQLRDKPRAPSQLNPTIPRAVEHVVMRSLEKQPANRYQSANELVQAYLNAITFPDLVEDDERVTSYHRARAQAQELETPRLPVDAGKLILPHSPVAAPWATSVKRRSGRRILPGAMRRRYPRVGPALPPLEPLSPALPQDFAPATATAQEETAQAGKRLHRRSRPVNRQHRQRRRDPASLSALIIGIALLVIVLIALPFTYFANQTNARLQATATANAKVLSTAQVLNAKETAQAEVTATAGVASTATSSPLLFADTLTSNHSGRWPQNSTCAFTGNAYHVLTQGNTHLQICPLTALTFDNAAIEADVSLLAGSDAGLVFRASDGQFYAFEITDQGEFFLRRHIGGTANNDIYLTQHTKSAAIVPGGGKNTLLVIASGADFKLFINGTFVGEAHDSLLARGQVGLAVGTPSSANTAEASFNNYKIFRA
jgi:serine/threonine protein kinase